MTTEPKSPKIHCSFVNAEVDQEDLNEHCDDKIVDGKCTACKLSEAISIYGAPVSQVITNITRSKP